MNYLTKKLNLPRLLIEAVLIFSSVYGAFLLEDRRSKSYDRKVLIGKLEKLNKVLVIDSALFESRLGKSETKYNDYYDGSISDHKSALTLLKTNLESNLIKVYTMHKEKRIYYRLFQLVIKSQHNIESIIQDFDHLIIMDSTRYWLNQYEKDTWTINGFVKNLDESMEEIESFGTKNYFVLSDNDKLTDILKFINHPFYYNSLTNHLGMMEVLKYDIKPSYSRHYLKIKKAIQREIAAQKDAI